jgi:hypothetical protein
VDAGSGETVSGVRFPTEDWPGEAARSRSSDKEPTAPNPSARILSVGIERGLRIAVVRVYPARWDPATGTAVWSREVTVTVRTASSSGRSGTAPPPAVRPDAVGLREWSGGLVNPEAAAGFRTAAAAPDPPLGGVPDAWFDDAGGWLKIGITENGVYALDAAALSAAGVPVSTVDPRSFRIFAGPLVPEVAWASGNWDTLAAGPPVFLKSGWDHVYERPGFNGFSDPGAFREIPVLVEGEEDGGLTGADRVVFYALGPDNYRNRFDLPPGTEAFFMNPYTNQTVYWLAWGGSFANPPRRLTPENAAPQAGTPVTRSTDRVHVEGHRLYAPSLYQGGLRWQQWFTERLSTQSNGNLFHAALPGAVDGTDLGAHIRLWGAEVPTLDGNGDDELHHVQVDVNGQSADLAVWGGGNYTEALTPQDVFVSGIPVQDPSDFFFRVPQVPSSDPFRSDLVYLAWIDVTYRRDLRLDGASGELPVDAGASGRTIRITAPPADPVYVLDVSDAWNPRLLGGTSTGTVGSDTVLDLAFASADSGVVAVWARGAALSPASLVVDDPPRRVPGGSVQWLRSTTSPLDYVIVAYDDFADEGERLADWRRQSLYGVTSSRPGNARVVRISDVMDEFSWGMWDPAAVRRFLEYAYLYYGGSGTDPLAYCLFLGDHTYDFRGYGAAPSTDFVPSWEDNREDIRTIVLGNVQYASDDPLAQFDDDDMLMDLSVGRLTVSSAAEAAAVIDKIVSQEETPVYGPWRAVALLAADDLCQRGNNEGPRFLEEVEQVNLALPPVFDRRTVYLVDYGTDCSILAKPQATADFIDAWNAGAWLVNYVGHGNESVYADERVVTIPDLGGLHNAGRYPLLVATASKSAKFNQPDAQSITESLVNLAQAGPVAAYGSVSNQTFATYAHALNLDFLDQLFPAADAAGILPVGLALKAAKAINTSESTKYVLFGDPATVPPVPGLSLSLTAPDTLERGGFAAVTGTVAGAAGLGGQVELRAEGPRRLSTLMGADYHQPGDLLFRGPAAVTADAFAGGFAVPVSADAGTDARIRGYAWGPDWDALGVASPLAVAGTPDPGADTEGPAVAWVDLAPVVTVGQDLAVSLADTSGIRLSAESGNPGIELVITDAGQAEVYRAPLSEAFTYDLGSHTRGTAAVVVPDLPNGNYTFTVNAFDTYDNPASVPQAVEIGSPSEAVRFSRVFVYPNPLEDRDARLVFSIDRSADVTIRIYTVAGRLVRRETVHATPGTNGFTWDARDTAGDDVANGVYLVQLSAPGKKDPVRVLERLVVMR